MCQTGDNDQGEQEQLPRELRHALVIKARQAGASPNTPAASGVMQRWSSLSRAPESTSLLPLAVASTGPLTTPPMS